MVSQARVAMFRDYLRHYYGEDFGLSDAALSAYLATHGVFPATARAVISALEGPPASPRSQARKDTDG